MSKKEKVKLIMEEFNKLYPKATCTLKFTTPLELLVATQLAAQCTDERVNIVTKELFKKYKSVRDFADADLKELEKAIKPTGFFRNKAKNIKKCCQKLLSDFNGQVPDSIEKLLVLPGVGRKTANVILGVIYKKPGIVVDTHFKRLSTRIGLTQNTDPAKIEFDIMKIVPRQNWILFSHQMVYHGRQVCHARNPQCMKCTIFSYCNFGIKNVK